MSHLHSKIGYAVANQPLSELAGMQRKRPYFMPTSSPLNPPILETVLVWQIEPELFSETGQRTVCKTVVFPA
jgi:hypothetical protein